MGKWLPPGIAISIHTLRVEGDGALPPGNLPSDISIHTLRVEGDTYKRSSLTSWNISIHTLRVEGDIKLNYYEE